VSTATAVLSYLLVFLWGAWLGMLAALILVGALKAGAAGERKS
jgi:hypothetical protein